MSEPTQEQIEEFWEWCGFRFVDDRLYDSTLQEWQVHYPDGEWHHDYKKNISNLIDLNNLFKYAVPKLNEYEISFVKNEVCIFFEYDPTSPKCYVSTNKDTALALFWALWQVKEAHHD